jgi:cyclophilin family peptidyl-prolyl cis-trans isomerase
MTLHFRYISFAVAGAFALAACKPASSDKTSGNVVQASAPDSFQVTFVTSRGPFVVTINRRWAPRGADRFMELVNAGFFDEDRFFRVVPGFVAQFGLNDSPRTNEQWDEKRIPDDSVRHTNARGTLVFATQGPDSRSHQLYVNLADNAQLDAMGFAPIGRVVQGMNVVDSLYSGYGDTPSQQLIQSLGNSYLNRVYPKLDYVKTARVTLPGSHVP